MLSKANEKLLAEALRNGDPGVSMEVVSTNDCVEDESMNAPCFKPRNRGGDWYYVEDSLKRPYIVKFVNRYPNYKRYYERYSGIPVPPEAHNCQFYPNPIEIDENTSDIIFIWYLLQLTQTHPSIASTAILLLGMMCLEIFTAYCNRIVLTELHPIC